MNEKVTQTIDLLSLIGDDKSVVSYRPRWNQLTGSITATILLQQLIYRWVQSGRRPFYKFTGPCGHPLCRPGDTWEEELGLTRRQFETARAGIAARTQGDIADDSLVSYWMTTGHCTWYAINEPLLVEKLAALYPAEQPAAVGIQLRLSPPEPFDKSANGNGGNVERRFTNPPMAFADLSNGDGGNVERPAEPFDKNANAIGGKRQQINRDDLIDHEEQRATETTTPAAPAAPEPPAPAAAAADPLQPILDWIDFGDALSPKERKALTTSTLLAWAYWVKLRQAERGSRVYNAVGLMRSQWNQQPHREPRADLLRLARGWLALDDDGRARLLGRLEWAAEYGGQLDTYDFGTDFPDIPPLAAANVYAAANGQLAPPQLSPAAPVSPTDRTPPTVQSSAAPHRSVGQTDPAPANAKLWRDALAELEMQMTRATFDQNLRGTTATLDGDELRVHARNPYAAAHLADRLHDLITRTVAAHAGRPLTIRYTTPEVQP